MSRGTARAAVGAYFLFLVPLVAVFSWLVIANPEQTVWVYGLMFTPAASALLAWPVSGVRPRFGRFGWRSVVFGVGLIVIASLGYVVAALAGLLDSTLSTVPDAASLVFGVATSLAFALGEELGWRGYLLPQLRRITGFWAGNTIVAAVWLVFHLPIIVWAGAAYAPSDRPLGIALLFFTINIVLVSFTIGALWEITHDVWMPMIVHGLWNVFIADVLMNVFLGSPAWLLGEFGFLPTVPLVAALAIALVLSRRHRPDRLDLTAS